jgi:hypothetical protein
METLRVFEHDGSKFRIYVTVGGAIAVERWNEKEQEWGHVPLREATVNEMTDVLSARYRTEDEEIARSVAKHT